MKHWTPEEDAELKRLYATEATAREIGVALSRTRPSIKARVHTLGLKKPDDITNAGCFLPEQTPWNKGRHFDSGGRSHETRFKPGFKPHTWQPAGSAVPPARCDKTIDMFEAASK